MNDNDARLWHPWLRINVRRLMLHTRSSAEAWSPVRVEFKRALALGARSGARPSTRRGMLPALAGAEGLAQVLVLIAARRASCDSKSAASASRIWTTAWSTSSWLCFTKCRAASRNACTLSRTSDGSIAQP
jgi:hypothetical protein